MMTGEREHEDFWRHLYEGCDPQICFWCQSRGEFVRFGEEQEAWRDE